MPSALSPAEAEPAMIFIVVKFPVKPDLADSWPSIVADFTAGTRAEPGNLFFEWSRSIEDPNTYVLVEGFADGAAEAHVKSPHFAQAMQDLPDAITARPEIISLSDVPQDGWGEMGELAPR